MKVKINKKFITVTPKPTKTIINGLWIEFDRETNTNTVKACTDLIAGKSRYVKPKDEQRKIIKAYIYESTLETPSEAGTSS